MDNRLPWYMKAIPARIRPYIRDFYKEEGSYWITLDCTGPYHLEDYYAEYTVHEDTAKAAIEIIRTCAKRKDRKGGRGHGRTHSIPCQAH